MALDLNDLSRKGKVFFAADADLDDRVTGQTSFADTTPTFVLDVPAGTTAIPVEMTLTQDGTVAGATVTVLMEIDNEAGRVSGGTSETVLCARTVGGGTALSTFYSNPTRTAGKYGARIDSWVLGQDVAPAEGAPNKVKWQMGPAPIYLVGPSSWLVYTFAGTTGPTWDWNFAWAEIDSDELPAA